MSEGGGGRELSIWEIHEAERPAQSWRQLPGVLARAARFVGAADPGGLAVVVAASVVAGVAAGVQVVATQRVRRYAQEHILAVTTRVDLAAFDDPTFHDRVQRATQGVMIGPIGLVQGF